MKYSKWYDDFLYLTLLIEWYGYEYETTNWLKLILMQDGNFLQLEAVYSLDRNTVKLYSFWTRGL